MKKSAIFINTGRGLTVDETALIKALEEVRAAINHHTKENLHDEIFGKDKLYPAPTFNFSSVSALLCVSLAMSTGASEMPSRKSRPFALGA